jgi:Zn-dependent protease
MPREEAQPTVPQKSFKHTVTYPFFSQQNRRIWFSIREIMHLAVAALLAVGAGLSLLWFSTPFSVNYVLLVVFAGIFAASFLAHELAHKIVAQRHGLWAEFRLNLMGTALTLLSMVVPYPKIISPGAVIVAGSTDHRTTGKISIAGPITNILLAGLFMLGAVFLPSYRVFLTYLVIFNSWIAVFNLIPFGVFDGFKIFNWSKKVWALAFAASAVLLIMSIWSFR